MKQSELAEELRQGMRHFLGLMGALVERASNRAIIEANCDEPLVDEHTLASLIDEADDAAAFLNLVNAVAEQPE
jgi:hypothetical protein